MVVIATYNESNYNSDYSMYNGDSLTYKGQAFNCNIDGSSNAILTNCRFYLQRGLSATGNINVSILAMTGTLGTSGAPTGTPLAVSDNVDITTISNASHQLVNFNFSGANQITLYNGVNYVALVHFNGGDSTNRLYIGIDSTSPTHAGNDCFGTDAMVWYYDGNLYDIPFYVEGNIGYITSGTTTTFSLSGINNLLNRGRNIISALGSFVLTGINSNYYNGRKMISDVSSFALTGINNLFSYGKTLTSNVSSFVLSGIDNIISMSATMVTSVSNFTLSGIATTLSYAHGLSSYLINITSEAFSIVAQDVLLKRTFQIVCDSAIYIYSGITTTISKGSTILVTGITYTVTGINITFNRSYNLLCQTAIYIYRAISARVKGSGDFSWQKTENDDSSGYGISMKDDGSGWDKTLLDNGDGWDKTPKN